jgi:hypothetical protein
LTKTTLLNNRWERGFGMYKCPTLNGRRMHGTYVKVDWLEDKERKKEK